MSIRHVKKFVQGKQGITGLLKMTESSPSGKKEKSYVYKTSQFMNHLCDHEYRIMSSLETIYEYCPHFCKPVEIIHLPINPSLDDPFKENTGVPIPVLLMEYIEYDPDQKESKTISLFDMIRETSIDIDVIISLVKRVILAILIAQEKCGFVHYDLHTMNVLVRKNKELGSVCLYVMPDGTPFLVPTYGYEPVIIDFGFGACSDMEGEQLTISLAYTDSGYLSPYYDPISDIKILLVSLSDDLKSYRPGKASQLRNIIKAFFGELRIDWESGWDNDKEEPVIEEIVSYIEDDEDVGSTLFDTYSHLAIDILHGLITLPIQTRVERDIRSLRVAYNAIIQEFKPIEKVLNNIAYSLYVFRYIIDSARIIRKDFTNAIRKNDKIRYMSIVDNFSNNLSNTINKIVQYAYFENNVERMLYALYAFQDQLETQLHYRTAKIKDDKFDEYRKCQIHSPKEMYIILDTNFPLKSWYDENTIFTVYDAQNKIHKNISLHQSECDHLNKQHSFRHPRFLFTCYEFALKECIHSV